jgi:hypothetical protein
MFGSKDLLEFNSYTLVFLSLLIFWFLVNIFELDKETIYAFLEII